MTPTDKELFAEMLNDFLNEQTSPTNKRERIGLELKNMRKQAKMTSQEVAAEIGTTHGTVYNYENGSTKIPLETAAKLLRLYHSKTGRKYSLDRLVRL